MSQNFLCCALVDAITNAERLPGLPERVKMNYATEIIRMWNACLLQIRAQALVRWKPAEEYRSRRRRMLRPHFPQQRGQITMQRDRPLVLVLRRGFADQHVRLHFIEVQIAPDQ